MGEQLLAAFEHAPSGVALVADDGRYLRVNAALCVMLGRPAEQLARLRWQDVVHPDDVDAAEQARTRTVEAGRSDERFRAVRPDGTEVTLRVTARALAAGGPARFVAHYEDVTTKVREATLEAVVSAAVEAIVGIDETDAVRIFSPSAERLLGWPAQEMIGRPVWDLVAPGQTERAHALRAALAAGQTAHREEVVPRRDGSHVEVFMTLGPIIGADGAYRGAAITLLDLSDRRRAEREADRSRDLLRQLIDNAPNVIAIKDRESRYQLVNRLGAAVFGRDKDSVVGCSDLDLLPARDAASNLAEDKRVMAAGAPMTFTKDVRLPDGSVRPHLTIKFPIHGPDGTPAGVGMVATDISEVRRGEADRARLGALAEAAPDAIVIQDADGAITGWNPGAEQMFDMAADEAYGRPYEDVIVPESERPAYRRVRRDLSYGRARSLRMEAMRADGSRFPAQVSAAALPTPGRGVAGSVAIIRDITDLVEAQRELERSNADLERFAYAASHDLQEPLRSIKMGAGTVMRAAGRRLDDDERGLLAHVEESAGRMSAQVQALMQVARVALEHAPDEPAALEAALEDALGALRAAIRETDARIDVIGPLPATAVPRAELAIVLQNVIGNAIKFRRRGEPPRVTLSASGEQHGVELRIADNGVGLTQAASARIFGIFERERTDVPGMGVGLAVCRRILERRGGSISASSAGPGRGSEFTVRLPAGAHATRL